ncbi:MerR family transcriptional regulator [Clostridium sp. 'deep sea']|uniref:MerR family transcriptional regulator n=1 Tax=Clostridium sp. 'deep sea' TaxID=2779445 RepID=UPI00189690B6|nr:MerR family transcriptional regulator [Clostridium sp. 'deep sea']QOR36351.1 MerR family transcriptional regulator [Clostridium sp. 'deep sea']
MKIGDIAKRAGLTISALRYYEKQNLIRNVHRNKQGLRDYTEDDYKWIKFLVAMKNARLSLAEISQYADLYYSQNEDFKLRLAVTKKCRAKLIADFNELQQAIKFLDKKITFYEHKLQN